MLFDSYFVLWIWLCTCCIGGYTIDLMTVTMLSYTLSFPYNSPCDCCTLVSLHIRNLSSECLTRTCELYEYFLKNRSYSLHWYHCVLFLALFWLVFSKYGRWERFTYCSKVNAIRFLEIENHTLKPKITTFSYIQLVLWQLKDFFVKFSYRRLYVFFYLQNKLHIKFEFCHPKSTSFRGTASFEVLSAKISLDGQKSL